MVTLRNYKLKEQPQAITSKWCFAYNLHMLGPLTMKIGTLMYFGGERTMPQKLYCSPRRQDKTMT